MNTILDCLWNIAMWIDLKNPDTNICAPIETKINGLLDQINAKDSIIESYPWDSEVMK